MKSNFPLTHRQPSNNSIPQLSNFYTWTLKITTDCKKVAFKGGRAPLSCCSGQSLMSPKDEKENHALSRVVQNTGRGRGGVCGVGKGVQTSNPPPGRRQGKLQRRINQKAKEKQNDQQNPQTTELTRRLRGSQASARSEQAKSSRVSSCCGRRGCAGCSQTGSGISVQT